VSAIKIFRAHIPVGATRPGDSAPVDNKKGSPLQQQLSIPLWQRNYHEHIIRSQAEWERIAAYIKANPANWQDDPENPGNL
jgi:REP element-mobilizing transposase RayT